MAGPIRARFLPSTGWISVPGAREFSLLHGEDDNLHALVADLCEVSLLSLARAANDFRSAVGERYLWMYFYAQEPEQFEPTVSPREPFNFEFFGERLRVRAQYMANEHDSSYPIIHQVVTPLLRRNAARVMRTSHQDEFGQVRAFVEFDYQSLRGRRVRDARDLAHEVAMLASAVARRGELDALAVEQLVASGRADLLVGQHEHSGFEGKGSTYRLASPEGAFELAKDVAAFANASTPGVIVCGLRTKNVKGSDIVTGTIPMDLTRVRVRDWVSTVRRLVVPAPEGLRISTYPRSGGPGYVLIEVPRQPEHLKPFLVRGGRRHGPTIVETDVTVPIRIGEHTEYSDPAALHGLLAAGRVALRQIPEEPH